MLLTARACACADSIPTTRGRGIADNATLLRSLWLLIRRSTIVHLTLLVSSWLVVRNIVVRHSLATPFVVDRLIVIVMLRMSGNDILGGAESQYHFLEARETE